MFVLTFNYAFKALLRPQYWQVYRVLADINQYLHFMTFNVWEIVYRKLNGYTYIIFM